jgi:signal transduction histidine kinase
VNKVDVTLGAMGNRLTVVVSDRGLGIDADDLPNIFKPFFRGRRAIDAQIRGSGVGLSVVRHIVEAHGGDVRAESRPGAGTTITIELPVARPPDQTVRAPASTRDVSA